MERLVRVSLFVIQSGATAGISSQAPVEAQAAKHTREDSAKTPQNPSTQPKPKTRQNPGTQPTPKTLQRIQLSQGVCNGLHIFHERLAHPPLGARASVEHRVEVVVIINACQQGGS